METPLTTVKKLYYIILPQEVGGTLTGEDGLVVMAGAEYVERYRMHQTLGFHVFNAIPLVPFQTLL
jgi:hypothetical protein